LPAVNMQTKMLKVKLKSTSPPTMTMQAELSSYDTKDLWSCD